MDYFMVEENCVKRLYDDYKKHKNLIIALDFDNTIFDFHNKGLSFKDILDIIKRCNKLNLSVIIYTANKNYDFIETHCNSIGIKIAGINKNIIEEFYGSGKLYYNILLDDRAGLFSSFLILKKTLALVEKEKKMEEYRINMINWFYLRIMNKIDTYRDISSFIDYIKFELPKYDVVESLLQSQQNNVEIDYDELWKTAVNTELFQLYEKTEIDYKQKYFQLIGDLKDISNQISQEITLKQTESSESSNIGKIGCLNRINYLIRKNK